MIVKKKIETRVERKSARILLLKMEKGGRGRKNASDELMFTESSSTIAFDRCFALRKRFSIK